MKTTEARGEIITFYSYKGGTGRTMALANLACILAGQQTSVGGNGVLMIDWDLEAPGLHRYFSSWMTTSRLGFDNFDQREPSESAPGLIDLFYELEKSVTIDLQEKNVTTASEQAAHDVIDRMNFSPFILPTTIGNLSLLKAGRYDPQDPNEYSGRVNKFNWETLFQKSPHLIRVFGETLASRYAYVLIDSRTGISDISGISTMLLPEKLVVVFTPNLQSLRGGLELIRKAADYRKESADLRPLTVFPLVSRIESSEPELKKNWRFGTFETKGFQREFEEGLSLIYQEQVKLEKYFDEVQIQHVPRYAYGEEIAVLAEETSDRLSLTRSYESFAQKLISQDSPWEIEIEGLSETQIAQSGTNVHAETWEDPVLESRLLQALSSFNWGKAEEICDEIVARIKSEPGAIAESFAKRVLNYLRRKRRFASITKLADVMLQAGVRTLQIRRQYAQALIDQGMLTSAEAMLQSIIQDAQQNKTEELEARGLLGRIYKQLYVTNSDVPSSSNRKNLERALDEYLAVYRLNPKENWWHGINVVALSARAHRDGFAMPALPNSKKLAQEILAAIQLKEDSSSEPLYLWDIATKIEVYLALGQNSNATAAALSYIESSNADAFEIASTLRQLVEVWQLNDREPPGSQILPILQSALLTRQGASIELNVGQIRHEVSSIDSVDTSIEAAFGADRLVTLNWYKKGLDKCNSIGRVETRYGKAYGTGFLIQANDFFPGQPGVLLLTTNHIVSSISNPLAISPKDCQINFQAMGEVFEVEDDVYWYSSYLQLDATFLKLKGDPKAPPLTLHTKAMKMSEPAPRVYIIGHPRGRDLELSLDDNQLLAANETFLHYRTATEAGSSGSPVFEPDDWRVVALHHKGSEQLRRIDGREGTYEANEGISILAIQAQTKEAVLS